ncbi:MAG: hypothetical protein CMJ88_06615 [Planctomycetes bacterium]|nr:hypothetical protein [Planctomycetota bacterium]
MKKQYRAVKGNVAATPSRLTASPTASIINTASRWRAETLREATARSLRASFAMDLAHLTACPICGGATSAWRTKLAGGRRYQIERCSTCSYAFVNPRPTLQALRAFYNAYGHRDADTDDASQTPESAAQQVRDDPHARTDTRAMMRTLQRLGSRTGKALDVGCGNGMFTLEMLQAGFDVTPLELAAHERRVAEILTGVAPKDCAFEAFEDRADYQVVVMSQVLEHAFDVEQWIAKVAALLARGGMCVIALPNFSSVFRYALNERDPYITPPVHLNFFNGASLNALLGKHGLEVLQNEWISRIPMSAFSKRLPRGARGLAAPMHAAARVALRAIDVARLGIVVRAYARKP